MSLEYRVDSLESEVRRCKSEIETVKDRCRSEIQALKDSERERASKRSDFWLAATFGILSGLLFALYYWLTLTVHSN